MLSSLLLLSLLYPIFQPAIAVTIDMEGLPDTGLDTSNWTAGVLPPLDDIWDLNDMQIAAKNVFSGKYYGAFNVHLLDVTVECLISVLPNCRLERVQCVEHIESAWM